MPVILNPRNPASTSSPKTVKPGLNPYKNPRAFEKLQIDRVAAAGIVEKITGDIEHKFDVQSAPGINGCYLIFKGYEAAKITIEMMIWSPEQYDYFGSVFDLVAPKPVKGTPKPVNCAHPLLAQYRLKKLYVNKISILEQDDKLVWRYKLECLEFFPPPKKNVAKPLKDRATASDSPFTGPPLPVKKPSAGANPPK